MKLKLLTKKNLFWTSGFPLFSFEYKKYNFQNPITDFLFEYK